MIVRQQGATVSCARIAVISFLAMSALSSRSRFFVNTVGTQTGSSIDRPHEPAEQQVVLHLLHQLRLGADREQDLHQRGPEQAFRRDTRPAVDRVERREIGVEVDERGIDDDLDLAQRGVLPEPAPPGSRS